MPYKMNKPVAVVRESRSAPPKSYTVSDITRLAAEWIAEQEGDTEMLKWTFSIFIEWLKQRERQ